MRKTIFAAALILAAVSGFAQTAEDFSVELTDDFTGVRIKKYMGKVTTVTIPSEIEGMPVTEIGDEAFAEEYSDIALIDSDFHITSVTFPASLVKIGERAFENCQKLSALVIPDSVSEIGNHAFANLYCYGYGKIVSGLSSVTLPKGLTKAGSGIFADCHNLKTVTIPEGVQVIGDYMFTDCPSLTSITIPNSVTSIGSGAFMASNNMGLRSSALVSITLGTGVTAIPSHFAEGCVNLKTIVIPEGVTEIGSPAFYECKSLTSVTLPSTIKKIIRDNYDLGTFSRCASLTTVVIPDSVETIEFNDKYAFSNCPKLGIAAQAAIKRRGYTGSF